MQTPFFSRETGRSLAVAGAAAALALALPFQICLANADFVYAKIRHDPMHECDASNFWHEHMRFRRLAEAPVSDETKVALGVFHSWGAHMPRFMV